jgi:hypothetical protein
MNIRKFFVTAGIVFAQLVMTQVVTFIASLALPQMENMVSTQPVIFTAIAGATFTIGIILVGWFALRQGWIASRPRFPLRVLTTLIGAYLPMTVAVMVFRALEAGSPFFFASIMAGILGFFVPGWFDKTPLA